VLRWRATLAIGVPLRYARAFTTGAALAGLAVLLASCAGGENRDETAQSGTPHLEATPAVIDLGDVAAGQWVTATFHLRNSGDAPLRFQNAPWVKAVAGC